MTWKTFALGVALIAATGAAAQTAGERPPSPHALAKRADAAAPAPTAVIPYGRDALQRGELRLPAGKGPFPLAILIHGGCFVAELGGTGMQALAEALRQRGLATWDIDYRRLGNPGGGWPGTFEDIATAVDHAAVLARRYPIDRSRVTVVGHSAGALFASWAAARPKLAAPWRSGRRSPRIVSFVAIDGPSTLAPMVGPDVQVCGRPVIAPFMGGTPAERPDAYRIASAQDQLPLGVKQLLVFGELGPFMQPYAAAARASGDPVVTLSPPGANHFDIVTPNTSNGAAVADWIAANAFARPVTP